MSYENEQTVSRWEQFKDRMQHTYRFILMNNETFKEVSSYQLTLLNIWLLISSVIVSVAAIVVCLIIFTPLKKYIPGYSDGVNLAMVYELNEQVELLEEQLESQRKYTESVKSMLVGEQFENAETTEGEQNEEKTMEVPQPVAPSKVDTMLRAEMASKQADDKKAMAKNGGIFVAANQDVALEQLFFNAPVRGQISAGFMPERQHFGVDILAPRNTPVKAALDGYIIFSDWTLETGNTLAIQHDNNIITVYKHNSSLLKGMNSKVKAGEAVAIIGNTGTLSDGPHLHFELWQNGQPVDPTAYITF